MPEDRAAEVRSLPPANRRLLKRWLTVIALVCTGLLLLSGTCVGVAEHRTSQPQFCGSCHIMQPYYDTWQADLHGAKLDVACVDCHYAPGERTTIKAKFRGLSQVASYFSGRYGATRPRAHVSNDSCTTSKCHGDLKFMDQPITLGTVKFVHAKHLRLGEEQEKPHQQRLAELEAMFKKLVGDERFAELEGVATQAGPADERYDKLVSLAGQSNVAVERPLLVEFSQLHHRKVRIAQLRDLQCTNCHAYHSPTSATDSPLKGHHFQVSMSTCYTCHFNNEGFNTGTNTCLKCHSPPQQDITVHADMTAAGEKLGESQLGTKLVKMNHAEILARKVDCMACHADTAREDSTVTRRDCEQCHDQPRFFDDWKEPFTLDLVMRYHQVHIEQQRAKCLDCHSEIKHKLIHGDAESASHAGFLTSALANCTQCHPNHHAAQVDLLLGQGGAGVPKSAPNLMFGARTNCSGCHIELSHDAHGGVIKATEAACIACHGDRHRETFEKWKLGLELVMGDAEQAYANARQMLGEKSEAPPEARAKATQLLDAAEADLRLVKQGNGLHNVTYAIELLDSVTSRCQKAMTVLSGN